MDCMPGYVNFKNLLNGWLDLQSVTINVTVSAAKYKISDLKKNKIQRNYWEVVWPKKRF